MTPDEFRKIRKAARMTQAQMAERLGVSRKTVVNWEGGVFAIPADALDTLTERGVAPVEAAPKPSAALIRDTVSAYREMRAQPGDSGSHANIVAFWHGRSFTPCREAMELIAAEFPDILNPKES